MPSRQPQVTWNSASFLCRLRRRDADRGIGNTPLRVLRDRLFACRLLRAILFAVCRIDGLCRARRGVLFVGSLSSSTREILFASPSRGHRRTPRGGNENAEPDPTTPPAPWSRLACCRHRGNARGFGRSSWKQPAGNRSEPSDPPRVSCFGPATIPAGLDLYFAG